MADLTQNISASINCFGGSPSTKWGSTGLMVWGTSKWGEGSLSVPLELQINVSDSLTFDTGKHFNADQLIGSSMIFNSDVTAETLSIGIWRYVFVSDTINAEERDSTSWTENTQSASSFVTQAGPSTDWT